MTALVVPGSGPESRPSPARPGPAQWRKALTFHFAMGWGAGIFLIKTLTFKVIHS